MYVAVACDTQGKCCLNWKPCCSCLLYTGDMLPYLEAMLLLLVLSQSGDRAFMVFCVSRGTLMYTMRLA